MDSEQAPRSSRSPESILVAAAESSPHLVQTLPYEFTGEADPRHPGGRSKRPSLAVVLYGTADNESEVPLARTRAIVDSGADNTTLPEEWAKVLGIDLASDCLPMRASTAGAPSKVYAYTGGLRVEILREQLLLPTVCFSRELEQPLLGRRDFFTHYLVAFDQRNSRFFLERLPILDDDDDDELDKALVVT
jgi:Aspartyl protease